MRIYGKLVIGVLSMSACAEADGGERRQRVIAADFQLAFSPVYSAFDGVNVFKVPLAADPSVEVDSWEIIDAEGNLREDAADIEEHRDGLVTHLTVRKAGDYVILAHSGRRTGCSELHVTSVSPEQVRSGAERYATTLALTPPAEGHSEMGLPEDMTCASCHGQGPDYLAIEQTPYQASGFSDEQLAAMITKAIKPAADEPSSPTRCLPYTYKRSGPGVPLSLFRWWHSWDATEQEAADLVAYMRSIPPVSQGSLDFQGLIGEPGEAKVSRP
jgi:hypothetical protein